MSYVVITGASAGIGECFARALAAEKQNLILVARREERLNALAAELKQQHGIEAIVLKADLADQTGADELARQINEGGWPLVGLINNAGFGDRGGLCRTGTGTTVGNDPGKHHIAGLPHLAVASGLTQTAGQLCD